jgi:hypothetical protein
MRFVLAGLVVLGMVLLAVGALTGRVRGRSCCADPSHDLRMRAAPPEPPDPHGHPPRPGSTQAVGEAPVRPSHRLAGPNHRGPGPIDDPTP